MDPGKVLILILMMDISPVFLLNLQACRVCLIHRKVYFLDTLFSCLQKSQFKSLSSIALTPVCFGNAVTDMSRPLSQEIIQVVTQIYHTDIFFTVG